jgi:hypothetical protein
MQISELEQTLHRLIPQFALVEGIYVLADDPDHLEVYRSSIIKYRSSMNESAELGKKIQAFEHDLNRRFIVADFLDDVVEDWNPQVLLLIAKVFAALVRDGLRSTFPEQEFIVEMVGDVDDEPLELCVTFTRAL